MSDLVGTKAEVCSRLEIGEDMLDELVASNQIPHIRLGPRKVIFPWRALERWLDEQAARSLVTSTELRAVGDVTAG